nr:hypothetical protein [Pandoravirus massiliensis]
MDQGSPGAHCLPFRQHTRPNKRAHPLRRAKLEQKKEKRGYAKTQGAMSEPALMTLHPLACRPCHCDFPDACDCGEESDNSSTEQITPFPVLLVASASHNGLPLPAAVIVGLLLTLVAALSVFVAGAACAALLVDASVALYRNKKWSETCGPRATALASEIERRLLADVPQARVMFDVDDAVALHMERDRPRSIAQTLWHIGTGKCDVDTGKVMELYVMTSANGDTAVYVGEQVRRVWTRLFEAPHGRGLWGSAFSGKAHYPLGSVALFRAVKHIDGLYAFLGVGEDADRVRHHFRLRSEALWRRCEGVRKAAQRRARAPPGPPQPPTLLWRAA